jgi:polysaccharide biosynthesis transport protein
MTETDKSFSTLHDYLGVLRRRKLILIPPVLLAPAVAVLLSMGKPVRYEASAQVLINRQNLANPGVTDPTQLDSGRLLTTQAQFARLPDIANQALATVGLSNWSASDLLGESSVTATDNSDFLTFNVSDRSPTRARALATAYAHAYVAYRRTFQSKQLESAIDSLHARIARLKRAGATDTPLYAGLLDRADELSAMEAVVASGGALVREATGAGRVASHLVRDGIFAFVLGLIAAIGLAFLRDALDQRPRSADDIEGRLRLRLLARLPRPPRALRRGNRLVMLEEPENPHAEAFRMARMSLEFVTARGTNEPREIADRHLLSARDACRRLMITSAVEGEGKSTTVGNLAVAFALAGRRVILVDLDFRRASLHRFFDLNMTPGIADVVLGSAHLDKVIAPVELPSTARGRSSSLGLGSTHLDDVISQVELEAPRRGRSPSGSLQVVPLGTLPPRAADAAFTVGLEQVLGRLAERADLMLIDSPPLLRVGDALALTSYVDELVVVTNLRAIRPAMLDELRRVLAECPAAKLGFIVTGADAEADYGYASYYDRAVSAS